MTFNNKKFCAKGTYKVSIGKNPNCDFIGLPSNGFLLNPLEKIDVQVACGAIFSTKNPKNAEFNYKSEIVKLYAYPALEGKYDIPNTVGCVRNNAVNKLLNDEAKDDSIMNKVLDTIKEMGVSSGKPARDGDLKNQGNVLAKGEFYVYLDKWIDLPAWGNINPRGQYNGKDVICSISKGLVEVTTIDTQGGSSYSVPTKVLKDPSRFCCEDQTCRQTYGNDYKCVEYSCVKGGESQCVSDLECQPARGELQDKNCYRKSGTNNFFLWSSGCVNGKCTDDKEQEVECCESFCSAQGLVCDHEEGCIKPIEPELPCPTGKCCLEGNPTNYVTNLCGNNLECCDVSNGVGLCKDKCEDPPKEICDNQIDDDADSKVDCEDPDCKSKSYCETSCEKGCNTKYGLTELGKRSGCKWKCEIFDNSTTIIILTTVIIALIIIGIFITVKMKKPKPTQAPIEPTKKKRKKRRKVLL